MKIQSIRSENTIQWRPFAPLILSLFDWLVEHFQVRFRCIQVVRLLKSFTADEIVHLVINCVRRTKTVQVYFKQVLAVFSKVSEAVLIYSSYD